MFKENIQFFICDFETTGVNPDFDFPIEIGGILTDNNFRILDTYKSLILYPEVKELLEKTKNKKDSNYVWPQCWAPAFNVHKIQADELIRCGELPITVMNNIVDCVSKFKSKYTKTIILSDNAQFEYSFMKKIFKSIENDNIFHKIFHYCAWDSSILLEGSGVGDPIPVHRAFEDSALLHTALIRACERVKFYDVAKV